LKRSDRRPLHAHVWNKDPLGSYVDEPSCSRRLFEVEHFNGGICDFCVGIGRVADAGLRCGYKIIATDLIDRGYPQFNGIVDFFCSSRRVENICCNPPYHLCRAFTKHALNLARMCWLHRDGGER
jgi:hypothetical protein